MCAALALAGAASLLTNKPPIVLNQSTQEVEYQAPCAPPPVERNGVLCVPVRFLEENLGCQSFISGPTQTVARYFGLPILFATGNRVARVNKQSCDLSVAPFALGTDLFVPTDIVERHWGVRFRRLGKQTLGISASTCLPQSIRHSVSFDKTRVVIDLDRPGPYSVRRDGSRIIVRIWGALPRVTQGAPPASILPVPDIRDVLVRSVGVASLGAAGADLEIDLRYRAPATVFSLPDPPRIVIDCEKKFEEKVETAISTGLAHVSLRRGAPSGPVQVNAVRANLSSPGRKYRLRVIMAGNALRQCDSPSRVAQREGAIAAVNGGYFAGNGSPLGTVVSNGEWVKTSDLGRTGLLVTERQDVRIDTVKWVGTVVVSDRPAKPLGGLNTRYSQSGGLLVFTHRWGTSLDAKSGETTVSVSASKVTAVTHIDNQTGSNQATASATSIPIPPDGYVILGPRQLLNGIKTGQRCAIRWEVRGNGGGVRQVLEAGPRLLAGGHTKITAAEERFRADITSGRAPRSAFGLTATGEALLVTVDGRSPSESIGATLQELTEIMRRLGAVDAVNLDGGGSTTLVINGKVRSSPSSGAEKRVSTILAIVPE